MVGGRWSSAKSKTMWVGHSCPTQSSTGTTTIVFSGDLLRLAIVDAPISVNWDYLVAGIVAA